MSKSTYLLAVAAVLVLVCQLPAQQANTLFAAYDVDAVPSTSPSFPRFITAQTDKAYALNVKAFPLPTGAPAAMLFSFNTAVGNSHQIGALVDPAFQLDLKDTGAPGYLDQILFSGWNDYIYWTSATGNLSVSGNFPACRAFSTGTSCIMGGSYDNFDVTTQAIVADATNAPYGYRSTSATVATYTNGYSQFSLSSDQDVLYNFKNGFTFKYYGKTYTQCYISSNGFTSFGARDTGFPSPSTSAARSGVPRIMCFWNDLEPQITTGLGVAPRIFAHMRTEVNGVREIQIGHEKLAEFSNTTGPHGGEVVITEQDDISVLVSTYNGVPSINTVVGITPGSNVDSSISGFGVDLKNAVNTGPTTLGSGKAGFELYDHGGGAPANPINLSIGFGIANGSLIGPGFLFLKDPTKSNTAPGNSGYIIQ